MCGIAGILNFNHQPVAYNQLKAMTDAVKHRGPDGEGHWVEQNVGLGHRRLAIIDLSAAGHQPMQTQNGRYTISYNGEVYNFQELRIQLEALGQRFHSRTDTEVVLNAFAEWGIDCVNKFNGMFAFAIWDKASKKLWLARDRYGIKPLYYFLNANTLIFGSEIKAILASGLYQKSLDKEGLVEYLTFQNFFTDKTLFKDIKILPAGHYAEVDATGKNTFTQFWDFDFSEQLDISEDEAVEELDRLFIQAVQRQLVSDVAVNSYLSGGIDSGAITMVASKLVPHLRTFTIGFDLSSASGLELVFDERAKAEHISYLAKTEHYEMVLKAGDMERCMESLVYHLEEPRVGQSYPNFYAAKLASKFGKVVLAGTGGDELFAGYPWRYYHANEPKKFDQFIDEYYVKWQRLMPNTVLQELILPIFAEVKHVQTRDIFSNVFKRIVKSELTTSSEFINYSLYLEAKTFLHGLLVVEDKLSMAHGLEARVPFLDNNLVDFAVKLPPTLKLDLSHSINSLDENSVVKKHEFSQKNGKVVLKKALRKFFDDSVLNNKKQGFSAPDASWFKGESIDYVKRILFQKHENKELLNYLVIEKIFQAHVSGIQNSRLVIWSLLYLSLINNLHFTNG